MGSDPFSRLKAEQQVLTAGLEEMRYVNRNHHPDHSGDRLAWRFLRHRRRPVLRHRLLWRRRPWPGDRDLADIAAAWKAVSDRRDRRVGKVALATCPPSWLHANRVVGSLRLARPAFIPHFPVSFPIAAFIDDAASS